MVIKVPDLSWLQRGSTVILGSCGKNVSTVLGRRVFVHISAFCTSVCTRGLQLHGCVHVLVLE